MTAGSVRSSNGRFFNPWAGARPGGFLDLVRWAIERRVKPPPPDPPSSAFPRVTPAFERPRAAAGALTVTWIGHASVLVQIAGRNVLIDPTFSERASPVGFAGPRRWVPPGVRLNELPPIDLVLISHNHYDHLDASSVRALAGGFSAAPWVAPLGVARLLRRWGARRVTELDWWAATELGPLSVMATPAQHFSARHFFDRNRSLWCGWGLSGNRRAVFFAGDTGYHPAFAEIGQRLAPLDVVLMPVGAYEPRWFMQSVHLNPEEAVRAFEDLTASGPSRPTLVPIHWGTFKLSDEPMDEPPRRVRAAWEARGLPAAELWIPRHGETRAF